MGNITTKRCRTISERGHFSFGRMAMTSNKNALCRHVDRRIKLIELKSISRINWLKSKTKPFLNIFMFRDTPFLDIFMFRDPLLRWLCIAYFVFDDVYHP